MQDCSETLADRIKRKRSSAPGSSAGGSADHTYNLSSRSDSKDQSMDPPAVSGRREEGLEGALHATEAHGSLGHHPMSHQQGLGAGLEGVPPLLLQPTSSVEASSPMVTQAMKQESEAMDVAGRVRLNTCLGSGRGLGRLPPAVGSSNGSHAAAGHSGGVTAAQKQQRQQPELATTTTSVHALKLNSKLGLPLVGKNPGKHDNGSSSPPGLSQVKPLGSLQQHAAVKRELSSSDHPPSPISDKSKATSYRDGSRGSQGLGKRRKSEHAVADASLHGARGGCMQAPLAGGGVKAERVAAAAAASSGDGELQMLTAAVAAAGSSRAGMSSRDVLPAPSSRPEHANGGGAVAGAAQVPSGTGATTTDRKTDSDAGPGRVVDCWVEAPAASPTFLSGSGSMGGAGATSGSNGGVGGLPLPPGWSGHMSPSQLVDLRRVHSFSQLWKLLGELFPYCQLPERCRGGEAKLVYLDEEGDWVMLTPDEPWASFCASCMQLLVTTRV